MTSQTPSAVPYAVIKIGITNAIFSFNQTSIKILFIVFSVFSTMLSDPLLAKPMFVYVAPFGNDQWSGTEDTPSPTTMRGPIKTLERAQILVRQLKSLPKNSSRSIVVLLRGGAYVLKRPLQFDFRDSGSTLGPVIWRSYPRERAVISSRARLVLHPSKGFWSAKLSPEINLNLAHQAFYGQKRIYRPRSPSTGFISFEYEYEKTRKIWWIKPGNEFVYKRNRDARPEFLTIDNWRSRRWEIAYSPRQIGQLGIVATENDAPRLIRKDQRAFGYIDNAGMDYLRPGNWMILDGSLIYYPESQLQVNKIQIDVPQLETLLKIGNGLGPQLKNFELRDLDIEVAGGGSIMSGAGQAATDVPAALEINNASCIKVSGVTLSKLGGVGIAVRKNADNIVIENSSVRDAGGGGIYIGESWRTTQTVGGSPRQITVKRVTVQNSRVQDVGKFFTSSVGIWVGQAKYIKVNYNVVSDVAYSGISIGWTWGYNYTEKKLIIVTNNLVYNIGGAHSDLAAIYTLGPLQGTIISKNVIFNVLRGNYGGYGIYADEGSQGLNIYDNIIAFTQDSGYFQHYGSKNAIHHNIFIGNSSSISCVSTKKSSDMKHWDNTTLNQPVLSKSCRSSGTLLAGNGEKSAISGRHLDSNSLGSPSQILKALGKVGLAYQVITLASLPQGWGEIR